MEEVEISEEYNFCNKNDPFIVETDRELERLAYGALGYVIEKIKKGCYYLIGKKYN